MEYEIVFNIFRNKKREETKWAILYDDIHTDY